MHPHYGQENNSISQRNILQIHYRSFIDRREFLRRYISGGEMPIKKKITSKSANVSDFLQDSTLLSTDIGAIIVHDSGMQLGKNKSIEKLIAEREHGLTEFTNSYKRKLACRSHNLSLNFYEKFLNRFLPNALVNKISFRKKLFCGIFSKEGDYFFSGCQDGKIRVYRPGPYTMIKSDEIPIIQMGWSILDIALNSDTSKLVYTSWSDKLYLCDFGSPSKLQHSLDMHLEINVNDSFCLFSVVFSNDDKEILGGSHGGEIFVYNLETMQRTLMASGHYDDINTVSYADESSCIFITGGDDGLCKVWDRRTLSEFSPHPMGVFAGHQDGIAYITAKKDGRCFLSNSKDQTIKLWDIRKFSSEDAAVCTQKEVSRRNWDYRWQSIPRENSIRMSGDTSLMTYRGHEVRHTLIRARFSPLATTGQKYIYCGSANGKIHIYELLTGKTVLILNGHSECVRDIHWHPYSQNLASSSWDGSLGYWTYSEESFDLKSPLTYSRDDFEADDDY